MRKCSELLVSHRAPHSALCDPEPPLHCCPVSEAVLKLCTGRPQQRVLWGPWGLQCWLCLEGFHYHRCHDKTCIFVIETKYFYLILPSTKNFLTHCFLTLTSFFQQPFQITLPKYWSPNQLRRLVCLHHYFIFACWRSEVLCSQSVRQASGYRTICWIRGSRSQSRAAAQLQCLLQVGAS